MNYSAGEYPVRGKRVQTRKSSGWAGFDLKQRRKQIGWESDINSEAYPVLHGSIPAQSSQFSDGNKALIEKSFSSVVNSHIATDDLFDWNPETVVQIDVCEKMESLKLWVDEIMDWDFLVTGETSRNDQNNFGFRNISVCQEADFSCNPCDLVEENGFRGNDYDFLSRSLDATKNLIIEPEFEHDEDDVYQILRKDAIRMTRLASRHSKAATDAYMRGDHLTAQICSVKAQEEWVAAKNLNDKAAKEILVINNSKNDLWTLDLHGLHAKEAVTALQEHLRTVELIVSSNHSSTANDVNKERNIFYCSKERYLNHVKIDKFGEMDKSGRPLKFSRNRPMSLQVITGKGNHSPGEAALPSAVRNFLNENRYHFDETRPGVIMVRPKFRESSSVFT